jgi:hypothetical protein
MKATVPFLLLSMLFIGPVYAGASADSCNADVKKYCPGVQPGGGAIEACLKKHQASLSPACTQYRQEVKNKIETFTKVCGSDIKTHCAKVQPGEGRVLACLKQQQEKLSPACKGQVAPSSK